ncbi:hypothetical protein [Virgibacillus oceani]|uniref:Uncharacterized protein n=1 Tax=Virgibacillus oceani TaxID=1479511 RepID=A0A917M688_9BACI|nr:hypothetical protein [Virgibacillus oceani]GGG79974.1 hypothetical protein GCM10011398_26670 [Virgibacillus oceani]
MDPNLVEKITRIVISKIEAHSTSFAHSEAAKTSNVSYQPLTEEELERWGDISIKLSKTRTETPPSNDYVPLTNDEIRQWKQISTLLGSGKQSNDDQSTEMVKFSRFY